MCGASSIEKQAFGAEQSVTGLLTNAFQSVFGKNTNIIDSLTTAMKPIIAAGPGQYGFTGPEDAAMRTEATDRLASAGGQESNAVRSAMASRGGGNTYLPSGSEAAINAGLAQNTAEKEAGAQLGITAEGYKVGRENFFNATSGLARDTSMLESPIAGLGSAAEGAAGQQFKGAEAITQANNAWIAPVAGLVGSAAGAVLGPAGAAIGGQLGQAVGGAIGGTGGCWIITAIYGKDTLTTRALWAWMTNPQYGWNQRSRFGKVVVELYYKYGEKTAELVKRNRFIRAIFKTVFDYCLRNKIPQAKWLRA